MKEVGQYHETVKELQKLMKRSPRAQRTTVMQQRASRLLLTILKNGERLDRKAKRSA